MEQEERFPGSPAPAPAGMMPLYVAVVHAGSTICHVAAATSPAGLTDRLGEYVRGHSVYQLRPEDADRVVGLLADGHPEEAVALYFARVGQRWDLERLVTTRLDLPLPADVCGGAPVEAGQESD